MSREFTARYDQQQAMVTSLTDQVSQLQNGNQLLQSQKQTLTEEVESFKKELNNIKSSGSMQLESLKVELSQAQAAASSSSLISQRDVDFAFVVKELAEAKYEWERLSDIEAKYEQQEAYVSELESQVSACQDQLNEF